MGSGLVRFVVHRWRVAADAGTVVLRHLKARHTEAKDLVLQFDRPCQRFEVAGGQRTGRARTTRGKLQSALRDAWDRTQPADNDDGFEEFREFA
jgi:hypothetical protein